MKLQFKKLLAASSAVGVLAVGSSHAGVDFTLEGTAEPLTPVESVDWLTGDGVSLGGILFPHFSVQGAFGGTTARSVESLAMSHHDPQANATLQTLEFGVSLRLNEYVEGFANYAAFTDADGSIDGEFEEAFLKFVNLPGGFELRGGKFLNRFGFQNALHSHAWDFVNEMLPNGRFLQEGELTTIGGEITWNMPTPFQSALGFSVGVTPDDDHDHGHGHGHHHAEFDGHDADFDRTLFGVNYLAHYDYNDFHQNRFTLSAAWGKNETGRTTQIYGVGYEYQWRENGYEPGGSYLRWRNEFFYRRVSLIADDHDDDHHDHGHGHGHGHHDDHHDEVEMGKFNEYGLYTALNYGFNDHLETGLRFDYISGISDMDLDRRFRVSPNVTVSLNAQRTLYARLQYDYDNSSDFGSEHSVWFQVGLNWGGPEVR